MFKISTVDTPHERRLVVEGTLVNPWVVELRRSWSAAGSSLERRKLVIDLTNATKIDSEGEAAIFELMQDGAKFCCSGVLTKHVLKELAHKCHTGLHSVLNHQRTRSEE
jgi:ABC-type transporter Mla MlaB component